MNNVDYLLVGETSLPDAQFFLEGYIKLFLRCFWKEQKAFSFYDITSANMTFDKTKNSYEYTNYNIWIKLTKRKMVSGISL